MRYRVSRERERERERDGKLLIIFYTHFASAKNADGF